MPRIKDLTQQQQALKNIKAALKELSVTNDFLKAESEDGIYTISFKAANGQHMSTTLYSPDKNNVNNMVQAYKDQVVSDMMNQAHTYRIELDPEDKAIFGVE